MFFRMGREEMDGIGFDRAGRAGVCARCDFVVVVCGSSSWILDVMRCDAMS